MKLIGRAVTRATAWAAGTFYRVERAGRGLPDGPAIIVTNHPNMLMDPLLVLRTAGRRVRALAKAPLFRIPLFGQVLRAMDTLPLYRVQDDPDQLPRNRFAYQEAVETLQRGGTLLMFPEGKSHSEPSLAPLKSGVARMALEAEDQSDWRLGVKIVPCGLAYERKHRFRSRVVVGVGPALAVGAWRERYAQDRPAAVRSLTAAVASALQEQTLNLSDESDRELVETADLMYARVKGWADWREREPLSDRLPRLRGFARQFAWLKMSAPTRWEDLSRELRGYARRLRDLGGGDAEVPPRYPVGRVVRYVVREGATLGLTLPLAAIGTIVWFPPYFLTGLVNRLIRPPIETIATVKLLAGIVLYPIAYFGWIALTVGVGGVLAGIAAALILPLLGYTTLLWQHRRREVSEDVRLFLRVVRHPMKRDFLSERRATLAAQLEALDAQWSTVQASVYRDELTGKYDNE
jgi:glycerol-3-phosphate O-acyltransferase/dihydroxyacetone phosphate acyltransferase